MPNINYLILVLVIVGLFRVVGKRYDYLKNTSGKERTKRKVFFGLTLAFGTFVGITSIFADALFEFLKLTKPAQFEWMAFAAFGILAVAGVLIIRGGDKDGEGKISQNHSGSGNIIGGDKIEGDMNMGDKIENHYHYPHKKKGKELTTLNRTNPSDIIGRDADLLQLHDLLFNNQKVVVVNGLGGIGKTTLADAYLYKYYNDYQHIAWITSDNNLVDDFAQNVNLIKNLDIQTAGMKPNGIFSEIIRKMSNLVDHPNLLIIDNATKKIEPFIGLLPSQPNWHLLVTSREHIENLHIKELGFLSEDDAIKLFQKHCTNIKDVQTIADIVEIVDYHTLSIEILAKTANARRTNITKLKTALKKNIKANIATKHSNHNKIEKITSYLVSIFDLSELTAPEIELMKQFACLPFEYHTYDLIQNLLLSENQDQEDFSEALTSLTQKGWISKDNTLDSYKMHRIIGEVVHQKQNPTVDDVSFLINQVTDRLSLDKTKDNPIDKFHWIPFGKAITNHFPNSMENNIAVLQNNLGLRLIDLGDYEGAKDLLEKAVKSDERNLGLEHPTTAVSYSNLVIVLQVLGDYEGSKDLLEKAVKSAERNLGLDHPTTAGRYSNLATVLRDLGDYEGAKDLLEKAVKSDERNFGLDHPTTAIRYSNLATVLKSLGDYEGAKDLLEKAVKSDERNFGLDHPNTAIRYSNLGTVLKDLGDYKGAKDLLEKAVKSDEHNFGLDHPTTAVTYSNLATVLQSLGDYEGAKDLLEKAVKSDEHNFGLDHPTTAVTYSNLATVLQSLGDYEGAKDLLEKAVKSDERNFGLDHPTTAVTYFNLALVLKDLGDYERALPLLIKTLEIFKKTLPEGHPLIKQAEQSLFILKEKWKNSAGKSGDT